MLEIESGHIAELNDEMLRNLVGLLCEEELKSYGINVRNVMWSGDQNAPDGGIDVYCEYKGETDNNSFIPRNKTGFQVKLSDYNPSKIKSEMLTNGVLKESIRKLCEEGGAYILVCGKSSVSRSAYENRIKAMKEAVRGCQGAESICLDYFDGNRIATWVRKFPALVVWVREKTGKPLQGWQSFREWSDIQHKIYKTYIIDQEKRIYDYLENKDITVLEGIQKFRNLVDEGAAIIRLTGLSGVGKTRFLEALFDKEVGNDAVNAAKVIYADAANTLCPTAEQMLKELAIEHADVLVIIDNCSASLHKQLMGICKSEKARLSLITVEYDVRDESVEETAAFILKPATDNVIERLISNNYPQISLDGVRHLVELSGGNARLALLLAKCGAESGRDVNLINDTELFNRLFWQKGRQDTMLEKTAEVFSLLYSADFEDEEKEGELYKLSEMAGIKLRDAVRNLQELKERSILQTRGKWCAILPHALSNYLAERSIRYYRKEELRKTIIAAGTQRMKVSFAHRLSFLANEEIVRQIAEEWLKTEFRDLARICEWQAQCFGHLAKVQPDISLDYLERDWDRLRDYAYQTNRFIGIVSDLAYYPKYFGRCIELLIKREKGNDLHSILGKYFQYNSYMNRQCADVRLEKLRQWMGEGKEGLVFICLESVLEHGYWGRAEYGDYYIHDKSMKQNTAEDERYWFVQFTSCIKDLVTDGKCQDLFGMQQFGHRFLALACQGYGSEVDEVVREIRKRTFWKVGFIAVQHKLHFQDRYTGDDVKRLQDLAAILRPGNLEEEILYWCTSSTYELYNLDDSIEETGRRHNEKIKHYGCMLADDFELYEQVSKRLILSQAGFFLFVIGRELRKSLFSDKIWDVSCDVLGKNEYSIGNVYILEGLIADATYEEVVKGKLTGLLENDALIPAYIVLVARGNFLQMELPRFLQVVKAHKTKITWFNILNSSSGFIGLSLEDFMLCIHALDEYTDAGATIFDLISTKLHNEKEKRGEISEEMKCVILTYIAKSSLSLFSHERNTSTDLMYNSVKTIISFTCSGKMDSSRQYISLFYDWVKEDIEKKYRGSHDVFLLLDELYRLQPMLFLDTFVENVERYSNIFNALEDRYREGPLSKINSAELILWCNQKPDERYNKVFICTRGYDNIEGKCQWRDCVLTALKIVRDRKSLVDKLMDKIEPTFTNSEWSIERERREGLFELFEADDDIEIVNMAKNRRKEYQDLTEQFRLSERKREREMQRFE